jgi:plasmid stability protein
MNGISVATKKAKVAGYVSDEIKKMLKDRTERSGRTESAELEDILIKVLDPTNVLVDLKESSFRILEEWAESEMRPLDVQIKWLLEKAIADYLQSRDS